MNRPRLLVLSHVLPFPGNAGQEQRVRETLVSARHRFRVTFATAAPASDHPGLRAELAPFCDEVLLLESRYHASPVHRGWHRFRAGAYAAATGLKTSNYVIGKLEFSPDRIDELVSGREFDVALFEYWHAASAAARLSSRGIPCVLDMHDILWQGRAQRLREDSAVPKPIQQWWVHRYRRREERAWSAFDALIAINGDEREYVRPFLRAGVPVFYAPMGTDLQKWSYRWAPAQPPRLAYYGGLGTAHNRRSAIQCYRDIMPLIWSTHPTTQLWLVGSRPSAELQALAADERVVVTGFIKEPQGTLATMTAVLCPWQGTYGFRSRLVEVMALGVPVVASPDAVAGMGLSEGNGLFLADDAGGFAFAASRLISEPDLASEQSRRARQQTEALFSLDNTYDRLMRELEGWLGQRRT